METQYYVCIIKKYYDKEDYPDEETAKAAFIDDVAHGNFKITIEDE